MVVQVNFPGKKRVISFWKNDRCSFFLLTAYYCTFVVVSAIAMSTHGITRALRGRSREDVVEETFWTGRIKKKNGFVADHGSRKRLATAPGPGVTWFLSSPTGSRSTLYTDTFARKYCIRARTRASGTYVFSPFPPPPPPAAVIIRAD